MIFTGGEYEAWLNAVDGAIVVTSIFAPEDPLSPPGAPNPQPPPLRRFSDWLFVVWKDFCEDQPPCIQHLNWVIHHTVFNPSCEDAATETLVNTGDDDSDDDDSDHARRGTSYKWPSFPGTMFDIRNEFITPRTDAIDAAIENFNAMVGCPNGYGLAYMLQQHQDSMGYKVIDQVYLFRGDDTDLLNIAYHILPLSQLPDPGGS